MASNPSKVGTSQLQVPVIDDNSTAIVSMTFFFSFWFFPLSIFKLISIYENVSLFFFLQKMERRLKIGTMLPGYGYSICCILCLSCSYICNILGIYSLRELLQGLCCHRRQDIHFSVSLQGHYYMYYMFNTCIPIYFWITNLGHK